MSDAPHRATTTYTPARASVVLERTYLATVQELWDLWTTRDGFESWWPPEGCRTEVRSIDARVNGELVYEMIAEAPDVIATMHELGMATSHVERARYAVFTPFERLVLRPMMDFLPGVTPYESTIIVDLAPSGALVRMVVTILPMHDEAFMVLAKQGLESQLRNIDRLFAHRAR